MGAIHELLDHRNITIENVGVRDYHLPIVFVSGNDYYTVCDVEAGVSIRNNKKGAHLSRLISTVDEKCANRRITLTYLDEVIRELRDRLEMDNANLRLSFDIIITKETPVTHRKTFSKSRVVIDTIIDNGKIQKNMALTTEGGMLCPNSKAISQYGAHNQKCKLKVTLYNVGEINLENILEIMNNQFSAEAYGLVKSPDEKYLTEKAYDNPKFSEDLIRDVLYNVKKYYDGRVEAELINLESIHQHNVFAKGWIQ